MSIHNSETEKKVNIRTVQKMKGNEPIVMITAYDALFGSLFDGMAEIILVGDSLNMSFMGRNDTLSATLDQMIYHTRAVCNAVKKSLVVLDMPFGSYSSKEQALVNCVKVYRETCAQAVKIEGGRDRADMISYLSKNGIAVMAHIGLMPQFVRSEGGYRVRGKDKDDITGLITDAKALEESGAFALVLEGMRNDAAKVITETVSIPTIGIGAGKDVDGQVLVWSDMFGFFETFKPKFVKHYMNGAELIREALAKYRDEVKERVFPDEEHSYGK